MPNRRTIEKIRRIFGGIAVPLLLVVWPRTAWALQTHGDPEGLHVHQLAHGFFAFSMLLLIYWLRKWGLGALAGWRAIRYSALFFILWNINAIVGHWLEELTQLLAIRRVDLLTLEITAAPGHEWLAYLYYLTKLDHLLCVPALFCLMLGLRRLYRLPARGAGGNEVT
jgi:hypothetical protein